MSKLQIRDTHLYVEEYGIENEKSIIYLHGGPGTSCLDFRNQAINLGKTFHVISFDQRGVLRSDAIQNTYDFNMTEHTKDIEALRVSLKINEWIVIGHSYGGKLAALYAEQYPKSVKAIIYECPSFYSQLSFKSCAKYLLQYFVNNNDYNSVKLCKQIISKDYTSNERDIMNDIFCILNKVNDNTVRNYLHNISGDDMNKIYSSYVGCDIPDDYAEKVQVHSQLILNDDNFYRNYLNVIQNFNCKQFLFCGKHDPVCSDKEKDYFAKNVRNGQIICFEKSGHFIRLEEPERYAEEIGNIVCAL